MPVDIPVPGLVVALLEPEYVVEISGLFLQRVGEQGSSETLGCSTNIKAIYM